MSERNWFKGSYSGSQGDGCVEVAYHPDGVHDPNSKEKQGPTLTVDPAAWVDFILYAILWPLWRACGSNSESARCMPCSPNV